MAFETGLQKMEIAFTEEPLFYGKADATKYAWKKLPRMTIEQLSVAAQAGFLKKAHGHS